MRSVQLELLDSQQEPDDRLTLEARAEQVAGRVTPKLIEARSILTRASGFMAEWHYTLNPYAGCGFGCNYCYAAFFARDQERRNAWGDWVEAKHNAVELIRRACERGSILGKSIYMSSVTDPYQPVERQLKLTRDILSELIGGQPLLTVQTRSPLVTRDINLLKQLQSVQVNMTVTTDSDEVVQAFEPHCPTNRRRLKAIAEVAEAGIDCGITMTPLLPVQDPQRFAANLRATGLKRFVVQPFHTGKAKFVRGTRSEALEMADSMDWNDQRYAEVVQILRDALPDLQEGRAGFSPAR